MTGLIFFVVGIGQEHRREAVEAYGVIGFGIVDLRTRCGRFQRRVVGLAVVQGKGQLAAENSLLDPHQSGAERKAELVHKPRKVARTVQFVVQPGVFEPAFEALQGGRRRLGRERLHHGLGGQHAAFHGRVVALDFDRVQGAGIASEQ